MSVDYTLEDSITIDAPPTRVWELVGDPIRMPEWSPQVTSARLRSGFEQVAVGAEFTNRNSENGMDWTTHGTIVDYDPNRRLAFRIEENTMIWSFDLAPTGTGGTLLTQRREAPNGTTEASAGFVDAYLGGQQAFTELMLAGMRQTLQRIKSAAEG